MSGLWQGGLRWTGGALALGLVGCATEFRIPAPVPEPNREFVFAAPIEGTWLATPEALKALGLDVAELRTEERTVRSSFRSFGGNDGERRTQGVARLSVDRDVYAQGRGRLIVTLQSADPERTRVRADAELEGKILRAGEIRYENAPEAEAISSDSAPEGAIPPTLASPGEWVSLRSNGVLEDEFFAALAAELEDTASDAVHPGP